MVCEFGKNMQGATIAEIGVAKGDFSEILMDAFNPKSFVAFDLFNIQSSGLHCEVCRRKKSSAISRTRSIT